MVRTRRKTTEGHTEGCVPDFPSTMGSFGGHALPGLFFILYAVWTTINTCIKYHKSVRRSGRFKSTAAGYAACGPGQNWPVEALMKLVLTAVGLSLEIYTGFRNGHFQAMGNAQHATMFFYFAFSGVIDLLVHFKAPLPPNTDYIMLAMAFMVEALLFKFHLHGRTELDVLLHTLLLYVVYCCIISVLLEIRYRHSILSPLTRAYFALLQGTWFWQIGFILYNPSQNAVPWKADDHSELTLATLIFAWHALANFIILLVVAVAINFLCRLRGPVTAADDVSMKRLLHSGSNGLPETRLQCESDSDLEFEQPAVSLTR